MRQRQKRTGQPHNAIRPAGFGAAALLFVLSCVAASVLWSAPASALVLPGKYGPKDTKVLVHNNQPGTSGRQDDGTSDAAVMFTPSAKALVGSTTDYLIYRYDRQYASTAPRKFQWIGTCVVTTSAVAPPTVQDGSGPSGPHSGRCSYDRRYGYVVYRDAGILNYEEYYYLVALDGEPDPATDPSANGGVAPLNGYLVAPAFPPTQTRHGNFSEYTNACNACHGLHSSKHKKLLKAPTATDLCGTCHDGTGSKYDEVRGRVRMGDSWSKSAFAAAGPFGDRLKAGSGVITTSVHNVMRSADGTTTNMLPGAARIWMAPGSGWLKETRAQPRDVPTDLGVSNDWGSFLVCTSCHEPHNRAKNYRILRGVINDRTYINVRGVSEVDRDFAESIMDRGIWGSGTDGETVVRNRAMYTRFLSGGNSELQYYDTTVEDPAYACVNGVCPPLESDSSDLDGDNNLTEPLAKAYCELVNNQQNTANYLTNQTTSPTTVRCKATRPLGGVTTFCSACHRAFMWPEAWIGRNNTAYEGGGTIYGYEKSLGSIPGSYSRQATGGDVENDSYGNINYAGNWKTIQCDNCSGYPASDLTKRTETLSGEANSEATFTFYGTGVTWVATKGPDRGIAKVYVDGVQQTLPSGGSLYNGTYAYRVNIFSKTGLTEDYHTIRIVVTGTKLVVPSNTDTLVGIDKFVVASVLPNNTTYSSLADVPGQHKHPISLAAIRAYENGRLVDGVLSGSGDVCNVASAQADTQCTNVGQGRLVDPIVPLEGLQSGKWRLTGSLGDPEGYPQNTVVCLTCHVAHGSGSERIEVAYKNDEMNDSRVYTCSGYNGDGDCLASEGETLNQVDAKRDSITGYLWNRAINSGDPLDYTERNEDKYDATLGRQDGVIDSQFQGQQWSFTEPVFDATGKKLELSETAPAYSPPVTSYYTQLGISSALGRFNPFASVCYRCHSTTPQGAVVP